MKIKFFKYIVLIDLELLKNENFVIKWIYLKRMFEYI